MNAYDITPILKCIFVSTGAAESTFELHVLEIIYRNLVGCLREELYDSLYGDIARVYSLDGPPRFTYPTEGSFFWSMALPTQSNSTGRVSSIYTYKTLLNFDILYVIHIYRYFT